VALQFGSRRFAPSLFGTLLLLVGVASVGHLGVWQLHRAEEKRVLRAQFEAGQATTRPLRSTDVGTLPRYQTVSAAGRYDSAHQVLLDNMPSPHGMPGFRALTPFALHSGGWIMVDRGWLPMGATRASLPNIAVGDNERTIVGRLDELPRPGVRLGSDSAGEGWPRVLNFPEQADLERALGHPVAGRMIRLDESQADGFDRFLIMQTGFGPDRHIAYAVQWFALGAAMITIYLLLSIKRTHSA